eukprot:6209341-Pleurochrysis_carterae.AAC.3
MTKYVQLTIEMTLQLDLHVDGSWYTESVNSRYSVHISSSCWLLHRTESSRCAFSDTGLCEHVLTSKAFKLHRRQPGYGYIAQVVVRVHCAKLKVDLFALSARFRCRPRGLIAVALVQVELVQLGLLVEQVAGDVRARLLKVALLALTQHWLVHAEEHGHELRGGQHRSVGRINTPVLRGMRASP